MEQTIVTHYFWGSITLNLPDKYNQKYRIGKFLNDGASASVYLLESIDNKDSLVLKIQKIDKKEWLFEEVDIHKLFNEYNIGPKLYDYWIINTKNNLYGCIVLEYLHLGEISSLYDIAQKKLTNNYYNLHKNIKFRDQIIDQIRTIHSIGYVHLDIFEHNILYRDTENITLCDFGLSCKISNIPIYRIQRIFELSIRHPLLYSYFTYKNITIDKLVKNPKLIDY